MQGIELDAAAEAYAAGTSRQRWRSTAANLPVPRHYLSRHGTGRPHCVTLSGARREFAKPRRRVISACCNSPKPPPERLSLTLPVINSSARVWLVVAGADKGVGPGSHSRGRRSINEVPAAGVARSSQDAVLRRCGCCSRSARKPDRPRANSGPGRMSSKRAEAGQMEG